MCCVRLECRIDLVEWKCVLVCVYQINSVRRNNSDTCRLIIELVIIEKRWNIYGDVRFDFSIYFYTNHQWHSLAWIIGCRLVELRSKPNCTQMHSITISLWNEMSFNMLVNYIRPNGATLVERSHRWHRRQIAFEGFCFGPRSDTLH